MSLQLPMPVLAIGVVVLILFGFWVLYLSVPLQARLLISALNMLGRRNSYRTLFFSLLSVMLAPTLIGAIGVVMQTATPTLQYYVLTGVQLLAVVQAVLLIVAFITWLVMFAVRFAGQPLFGRRYELFVGWNLLRTHQMKGHQPRPYEGATPPKNRVCILLALGFLALGLCSYRVEWAIYLGAYSEVITWVRIGIIVSILLLLTWPLRRSPPPGHTDLWDRLYAKTRNLPNLLTVTANTFISIVGVGVGVWAVIVVLSVMSGFENDLRDKILRTNPHIVIQDDEPMEGITDFQSKLASIRNLDGVVAAIPYVQGDVIVTSRENRNISLTLRGISPDDLDQTEHHLETSMVSGTTGNLMHPERLIPTSAWTLEHSSLSNDTPPPPPTRREPSRIPADSNEPGIEPTPIPGIAEEHIQQDEFQPPSRLRSSDEGMRPGILLGEELAISLRVGVGGEVTVVSPRDDAGFLGIQPRARTFRVAGIFRTGLYEFDLKLAYIRMSEAQRFFQLGSDINRIELRLSDVDSSTQILAKITPLLGSTSTLRAVDWKELNRNLFSALQLEKLAMLVVLLIIIAVAALNVLGSLLMLLLERGREVAILKSLGATSGELRRIFISLGSVVGAIGSSAGLLMGLITVGFIRHVGVRMPRQYYVDQLPVHIDPVTIAMIFILGIALCITATLYPAFMASRGRPVEGFRNV